MRYHVLAADYDGTLAHHGRIEDATWAALHRLRDSGRKVVMVTGRQLDDLLALLAEPELFARIVAENGAVIHVPETKETRALAEPPPAGFADELRELEITRIRQALEATGGNQTRAAGLLAMPVRTFFEKAKQYGLTPKKKRYDH